jgi:DNA-binding Xre family transcriptional regulator
MLYINLNTYLSQLKAIENSKPAGAKRLKVPNITELAEAIGLHQTSLSRIANNRISHLNLEVGNKIIDELRRRGFEMRVTDLLVYREDN